MNAIDEAMQSIKDMHSSMTDLAKEYGRQIDELKVEVQAWKQRYEAERQKNSCLSWTIERLEGK